MEAALSLRGQARRRQDNHLKGECHESSIGVQIARSVDWRVLEAVWKHFAHLDLLVSLLSHSYSDSAQQKVGAAVRRGMSEKRVAAAALFFVLIALISITITLSGSAEPFYRNEFLV